MSIRTSSGDKLTWEDYLGFPEDGRRHEIVDGVHVVNPTPATRHQIASREIGFQFYVQLKDSGLGQIFNAPFAVRLSPTDVVEPDLVVVAKVNEHIVVDWGIDGAPDLIIEILSPSTAGIDRGAKRVAYESAGVREYWIVDPDARVVEQYELIGGRYRLFAEERERVTCRVIPAIAVDLADVFP